MRLDSKHMRYLAADDWRVLTAVEMGSKNHEVVPTRLIEKLSRVRGGSSGVHKSISTLAKADLISRVRDARYDGYRLTYGGLDYLALHTHSSRRDVYSVGSRIGVGKESDITVVADEAGTQRVLKIHRLGRISFRTVKSNRDYLKSRSGGSWLYLSRLSAMKEFAFMQALHQEGFPVPNPIAHSRHTVLMEYVDGIPLRQVSSVPDPAGLYSDLISLVLRLAEHGLIHGDFNEFNILIKEEKRKQEPDEPREPEEGGPEKEGEGITLVPVVIDFPQMVSMLHPNAEEYFDRDVLCVKRFFERRFHFISTQPGPFFEDARKAMDRSGARRLDAVADASGFTKKMHKDLEAAIQAQQSSGSGEGDGQDSDGEESAAEDEREREASEGDEEEGGEEEAEGEGQSGQMGRYIEPKGREGRDEQEAIPGRQGAVAAAASMVEATNMT